MARGPAAAALLLGLSGCWEHATRDIPPVLPPVRQAAPTGSMPGAEAYRALRGMALAFTPTDPTTGGAVHGVVVDWGFSEGVIITTVALCDGSASLYFSNGGGVIGAGENLPVQEAAKSFLAEAAQSLSRAVAPSDAPLATGDVRFHVLLAAGRSMIVENWPPDVSPDSERGRLLSEWQALITAIRQTEVPRPGQ
jgi:hypothetical protein